MKNITLLLTILLLSVGHSAFAKDDRHDKKKKSISKAISKLFRHQHRRPKAGQIITWNGYRWVPVQYGYWDRPGRGSEIGEQRIWDGHRWIDKPHHGGGNSVEITAGVGLLANGQAGGVINDKGVLEVNIGTSAGQIPFINDDGDMAVDGFIVSGDGIIFPDGSVQQTAAQGIAGPQGPAGPAGADGAPGVQGPAGPAGADGAIGPQGPQGPAGAQGPQGLAGAQGPAGPQGVKGDKGDTGAQGPAGLAGATGAQGPQGPIGPAGAQGPQGIKGDKGDKGDTGAQGPAGPQGPQGLTGAQGPQGPAGLNGADGAPGVQGPAGPIGPQGPAGSDATVSISLGAGLLGDGGSATLSSNGSLSLDVGTAAGQIAQVGLDGKLPAAILPASSGGAAPKIAFLKDVKPSGTSGGACSAGVWHTRDLNTIEGDSSIVSLAGNVFTLEPGKYEVDGIVPAFLSSQHKSRVVNNSESVTFIVGGTGFSNSGAASMTQSDVKGIIEIAVTTSFRLQHRCAGPHGFGFGYPAGFDENEVYSQIKIVKID